MARNQSKNNIEYGNAEDYRHSPEANNDDTKRSGGRFYKALDNVILSSGPTERYFNSLGSRGDADQKEAARLAYRNGDMPPLYTKYGTGYYPGVGDPRGGLDDVHAYYQDFENYTGDDQRAYMTMTPAEYMASVREDLENEPGKGKLFTDDELAEIAQWAGAVSPYDDWSSNPDGRYHQGMMATSVNAYPAIIRLEQLAAMDPGYADQYRRLIEDAGQYAKYYGIGQGLWNPSKLQGSIPSDEDTFYYQKVPDNIKKK